MASSVVSILSSYLGSQAASSAAASGAAGGSAASGAAAGGAGGGGLLGIGGSGGGGLAGAGVDLIQERLASEGLAGAVGDTFSQPFGDMAKSVMMRRLGDSLGMQPDQVGSLVDRFGSDTGGVLGQIAMSRLQRNQGGRTVMPFVTDQLRHGSMDRTMDVGSPRTPFAMSTPRI